jgi:DNA-binding NtrC family response regulator
MLPSENTPTKPVMNTDHAPRVLIADDEKNLRTLMSEVMRRQGYAVETAENGEEAVAKVRELDFDVVLLDVKMPRMDGLTALREIRTISPNTIVVMMTAFENREVALESIRHGAYDFFNKPFELEEIRVVVRRAIEKRHLLQQINNLEERLQGRISFDRIIGRSDAMRHVFDLIQRVVTNDVTVLVTGESGTGKELVAQAIHFHSTRPIRIDVRVVAATNQNLQTAVENKTFREDLFFRLNVLPIVVPPLRKRQADIALLVNHFIGVHNPRLGRNIQGVDKPAMEALEHYFWPGNVRELENVIQRSMVLSASPFITLETLPDDVHREPTEADMARRKEVDALLPAEVMDDFNIPMQEKIDRVNEGLEIRLIEEALNRCNGKRQPTADLLGISRKSLHNKMAKYELFADREDTESDD